LRASLRSAFSCSGTSGSYRRSADAEWLRAIRAAEISDRQWKNSIKDRLFELADDSTDTSRSANAAARLRQLDPPPRGRSVGIEHLAILVLRTPDRDLRLPVDVQADSLPCSDTAGQERGTADGSMSVVVSGSFSGFKQLMEDLISDCTGWAATQRTAWAGCPRPVPKRRVDSAAQGSFVFKARQAAHSRLCKGCRNTEDGQNDKYAGM